MSLPVAAQTKVSVSQLADMTLEQLSNLLITSVSRREEPLADAAASVFVITQEDIRLSSAKTLAEALGLAPTARVMPRSCHIQEQTRTVNNALYSEGSERTRIMSSRADLQRFTWANVVSSA